MPVHSPLLGRKAGSTWSRVAWSTGASRSASCTTVIAGEFSVRKTSAGERAPSATIWLPIEESVPCRTCTCTPVCAVNPSTQASTRLSCCAL